ncbi:MAG: hypothetical protein KDE58_06585, partial [Caldilineaceae bacterium]|nr:hypothetical protein [Caldilineaceae bacterium]
MTNILPSVVCADPRLRATALLALFGCLLVLSACQPITAPLETPQPSTVAIATLAPAATPAAFLYGVTVLDSDSQPIPKAQVLIEIQGKSPLENSVDEHGYTEVEVPTSHAGRAGRLRVRASGFEPFNQYIDIYPDRLPNEVRLIAQIAGNTAGFCPDNLTFATGFAPAGEGETLVVVSNFADTLGNDPRNLTFDLIERMVATLAPHEQIRVERLNCAIKQQGGSETAMRIGSRSDVDARIVIWGV